jgi:streptomycin 6-kinase
VLRLPDGLAAQAALGEDWSAWLAVLPGRIEELLHEWQLVPDPDPDTGAPGGEPVVWHGYTAAVLPVRDAVGAAAVLKVGFDGDEESRHEALALQHWGGRGAVQLLRADPGRRALLLERLRRRDLADHWDVTACEVVAALYGRLHRPAMPQLRAVTSYVARWLDALASEGPDLPLPRRMVAQTLSVGRDLVADPASTGRLVHGDLHYGNVLTRPVEPERAEDREDYGRDCGEDSWVAIDPKPMSGDPHYEPAPMLWNRWDDVLASHDVRGTVRQRFHTLVDTAGLDEHRARDWVVVRSVVNAHWSLQAARDAGRELNPGERAHVTTCLAVAKAVQD